jgi:hypothetical protein
MATSGGSTNVDPNHLEAWKGLIDFAKTVLSLSTAVLAAYVSYVVVNGDSLHGWDFISPGLLVASIILSLFGFGRALPALKSGNSSVPGIFMTNASVAALVLAICLIPFTQPTHPTSIDQVLARIEASTKKYAVNLAAGNCHAIERKGDSWVLDYAAGGATAQVIYSIPLARIESVR